jgi:hypothetical protein
MQRVRRALSATVTIPIGFVAAAHAASPVRPKEIHETKKSFNGEKVSGRTARLRVGAHTAGGGLRDVNTRTAIGGF